MSEGIPETYQIIGRIGGGNSGVVYKAYHTNLKKYVVLKKIRSEIKDFVDVRAEADLLKNLRSRRRNIYGDGFYSRKFH